MLVQSVMLLTLLTVIPSTLSRHTVRKAEKESESAASTDESSNSKRQLQKTHLRIHLKPPKTIYALEGDSKFLECQAGGSPSPAIHWLKDGKIVFQSESTHNSKLASANDDSNSNTKLDVSFTSSKLFLDCLSMEDEAEFTCVAENPYHRMSTSTRVIVLSSDDEVSCKKKREGQVPRIHTWTKTMITSQGQQTRLICRADGYPRPTIRWLGSEEEELAAADVDKYEILPDGDLIIRNLKWSDMGNYHCVAENIHGENRTEVFLYPAMPDL